jgi:hypothetical protein
MSRGIVALSSCWKKENDVRFSYDSTIGCSAVARRAGSRAENCRQASRMNSAITARLRGRADWPATQLRCVIAACLLSVGDVSAIAQPRGEAVFVCNKFETIGTLLTLEQQNDRAAIDKLRNDGLRSGDCKTVPGNTLVFVAATEGNKISSVRQRGETSELWTLTSLLPPGVFPGR